MTAAPTIPAADATVNVPEPQRSTGRRRRSKEDSAPVLGRAITSRRDRGVLYLLLIVMGIVWAFPMYSAVKKSLAVNGFGNYISLFTEPLGRTSILQTYLNSFIIGIGHALIVIIVSTTAGYAFSKLVWPGRELGFAAVLLFLAIPGTAIIVPVYFITQQMGLFNNYLGVSLPEAAITIPFGVLLMRNYGQNVSDSLIEAAKIDGANHLRIFRSVFLPLARPAVVNLTVLCFIWSIQDFMWPSIVFTDPEMVTAAQAVATFNAGLGAGPADVARYNASLVLLAVPAIIFVLFGMRFIINGLTSGADKG
jgi:ABC-type glycerol-3-phosphate transport system permease component